LLEETYYYFTTLPLWELTAVILSVAYVVLVAKNNPWCWPAAFVSTLIFAVIFYDVQLLMDSLLQLYYLIMAIYGWYCWHNASFGQQSGVLAINRWSMQLHLKCCGLLLLLSALLGSFMANYTQASFPYLDTLTTVFAVFATYLVTQKILENWLYWIAIDLLSIYLYISKELTPTAWLFAFYVVIAILGYWQWRKLFHQEKSLNISARLNLRVQ
jgi:nicotinamide mononucleotide transporter